MMRKAIVVILITLILSSILYLSLGHRLCLKDNILPIGAKVYDEYEDYN